MLDRFPLVAAGGLELDHHLAALHLDRVAQGLGRFTHFGERFLGHFRCQPVMQRDARALVLEHQATVALGEAADAAGRGLEHIDREAVAVASAFRVAALVPSPTFTE